MADARDVTGALQIVKLRPDGSEGARYMGRPFPAPDGWIAARAVWEYSRVDIGAIVFEPGDVLEEFFALDRYYNAFAVYRAGGAFAGWYCNVTYPTSISDDTIYWHDLYVDVLVTTDGQVLVLDEDELFDSGLHEREPALHAKIMAARDQLLDLIEQRAYPFSTVAERAAGRA